MDGDFRGHGLILMALSIYHAQVLPSGGAERRSESIREMAATFKSGGQLLKKPNIYCCCSSLSVPCRRGQVVKIGRCSLWISGWRAAWA